MVITGVNLTNKAVMSKQGRKAAADTTAKKSKGASTCSGRFTMTNKTCESFKPGGGGGTGDFTGTKLTKTGSNMSAHSPFFKQNSFKLNQSV